MLCDGEGTVAFGGNVIGYSIAVAGAGEEYSSSLGLTVCVCQVLPLGHRFLWLFIKQEVELCCGSIYLLSLCFSSALYSKCSLSHT